MKLRGMPPSRRIAPVVIAVALLHAWILRTHTDEMVVPGSSITPAFMTRQVPPAAPAAPAAPAPTEVAQRTPVPEPSAPQETSRAPAPIGEAAPSPPPPEPAQPESPAPTEPAIAPLPPSPPTLVGAPAQATLVPDSVRMHYEVELQRGPLSVKGHALLHWRNDGNRYEARLEVGAPLLPTRVQTSSGVLTPEGLAPMRFSDKSRTEEATHFVRDEGKVIFSANRPEVALVTGMQDRLSLVIQLSALVGGDPTRYPAGTSIAIPTAGTRDADTWVFTVEGEEDLSLPGGAMKGLKLVRTPRKEFDTKVELWLAPRLDYAPVRLRLTSPNGDSVDQRWSSADKG